MPGAAVPDKRYAPFMHRATHACDARAWCRCATGWRPESPARGCSLLDRGVLARRLALRMLHARLHLRRMLVEHDLLIGGENRADVGA